MLASLLVLLDLFGKTVTINFFGKAKFRSQFGGACSILFWGFLAWALYNASVDMFSKQNPNTINSQTFTENPKPITLTSNNFPMVVQLEPPPETGYLSFRNESIFTVNFVYVNIKRTLYENGTVQEIVKPTRLAKEPCTLSHFGEMADSFSKMDLSTAYCIAKEQPDIQDLTIQGGSGSPEHQFIVIRVDLCNNQTSEVPCASDEDKKRFLNGAWIYAYFIDIGVDPNNYTHPDSRFRTVYKTMVSLSSYKEASIELSPVYVKTDRGWLMEEQKTDIYTKVSNRYEYLQAEPDENGILFRCYFMLSQAEFHYSRSYKKVQNVLAEVGGLANVALGILMVITTPYLSLKFRESLINELFDIHPLPPKKKKSDKKKKGKKANSLGNAAIQEKNQEKITTLNDPNEYIKTDNSPNKKSLFKKDEYKLQKANSQNHQADKDPFCLSPSSPMFQINSFTSNPDEKDLLSQRNTQTDRSEKNMIVKRKIQSGDNLPNNIRSDSKETEIPRKDTEGHVSIKIKEQKDELDSNRVMHKTGMTKVKSKQDISDDVSVILGDDNFLDYPTENNRQELDFGLPSDLKEDEEKDPEKKEVHVLSYGEILDKVSIQPSQKAKKESYKISISLMEYFCSFFSKSESLKQKMQILEEGTKRLNSRLDAVTILKKMREVDKLKAILFDLDQAQLFNNLPKPELVPKSLAKNEENVQTTSPYGLLRKSTLKGHHSQANSIRDVQSKLESKIKKSEVDERFIAVFKEKV